MFLQLFLTIKVKLVDEMMQSKYYLCAIVHVKRKKVINSHCFYLFLNT